MMVQSSRTKKKFKCRICTGISRLVLQTSQLVVTHEVLCRFCTQSSRLMLTVSRLLVKQRVGQSTGLIVSRLVRVQRVYQSAGGLEQSTDRRRSGLEWVFKRL